MIYFLEALFGTIGKVITDKASKHAGTAAILVVLHNIIIDKLNQYLGWPPETTEDFLWVVMILVLFVSPYDWLANRIKLLNMLRK